MRIVFDKNVPVGVRRFLSGHEVRTFVEMLWYPQLENGELLDAAEALGFDVMVTSDQNIRYQPAVELSHGWQSMSHVRDFEWFFAPTSQVICPLIGFALFWTISWYRVGHNLWKPVAIALLAAIPNGYIDLVPGHALPWIEAARTNAHCFVDGVERRLT